jgi:hypothetical protein
MRIKTMSVVAAAIVSSLAGRASAGIIVSLAGDRDSFGTGKPDGSTVSVNEILVPGGEDGTFDRWGLTGFLWSHSFVVPAGEVVVGASLRIATLDMEDNGEGDGLGGAPYDDLLFHDGLELAGAFDDVFTAVANANTQITPNISIFDLSVFLGSLADGTLNVQVDPGGGSLFDSIAIDYSELTISTRAAAPEPTVFGLLGFGLAWTLLIARRPTRSRL